MEEFIDWLETERKERGWTIAEFARQAGIGQASLSRVLSGNRGIGPSLCTGIAHVLNVPPEYVFRKAGLLPPEPDDEKPSLREALYLFNQLDSEERGIILKMMRGAIREKRREPAISPA